MTTYILLRHHTGSNKIIINKKGGWYVMYCALWGSQLFQLIIINHFSFFSLLSLLKRSLSTYCCCEQNPTMTKITQIDDRSATIAWSPIQSHADIVALGAKVREGGRGFCGFFKMSLQCSREGSAQDSYLVLNV